MRGRVLEVLAARFDVPVTVMIAGAGFGKTTALGQAMRANGASPRGIDAWIACEPGDEDAGRLSAAILAALEAKPRRGGNVERVLDALSEVAPVDVCLIIDDLHELPAMSAGLELVRELAARLPAHGHLVLASREPVPIPLARRRAAGQVVELGVDALAFSEAEVAALAGMLGGDHGRCTELAGWPSLVRLVLSAPPGALPQFLWEEVVGGLPPADRSGLLALAVLGSGSPGELAAVAGEDLDIERLLESVPLLYQDTQGRYGAHELWADAVERIFPAPQVAQARRRALHTLRARGETVRMGSAAVRWRDPDMFRVAALSLVLESLGALPIDTAARWLASPPHDAVGTPEHQLLGLALRHAQRRDDEDLDAELDELERAFCRSGNEEAQGVTLAVASVVAHARADHVRLVVLAERIRALPGAADQPLLSFLVDAVDAALASLVGDVAGALRIIESMSFEQVPRLVRELVTRLHVTMLGLAGRADEAVRIASSLLESPHAYVRSVPQVIRWAAGDPSEYLAAPPVVEQIPDVNHRDRFVRAAHGMVVAAALGDRVLARTMRRELEATVGEPSDARDSAIAAAALACGEILRRDDVAARAAIADHIDRHPLSDSLGEAHLRRVMAVAYVCDTRARDWWDVAELGNVHVRVRAVARHVIAARDGHLGPHARLEPPEVVVTCLPLAWSVDLAVRAHAAGCPDGDLLVRALSSWLPDATRQELEWLATHGDAERRRVAALLLADIPAPGEVPLRIDVLGPMRLHLGDEELSGPELRRGRVRTLLALLVLRGPLRRERICDLLWADLEPTAAAQNLRVTLSRLRRLLEPRGGDSDMPSTSRLRVHGDTIELAGPPLVETDVRRVQDHLAEAEHARRVDNSAEEVACLERAVALWRGDLLVDLASIGELDGEVEHIRRSLLDATLRLGELELIAGRFDEALRCAERGRLASPWSERAHRLAIACHLQRHDRAGLDAALRSTRTLLDDLGVEPEEATQMLLRRGAVRLGTSAPA